MKMVRFTFNPHFKIENPIVIGEIEGDFYFLENERENEDMLRNNQHLNLEKSQSEKETTLKFGLEMDHGANKL